MIENSNYFSSGSHVDTCKIGNANVFEAKTLIGYGTQVGDNCTVKAGEKVPNRSKLPDNTIVHWEGTRTDDDMMSKEQMRKNYNKNLSELLQNMI